MKRPLFQTSLKSLLLATLWCGVAIGAWSLIIRAHRENTPLASEAILTWGMLIAPFAATGAFIGRAMLGLVVGIVTVTLFWFVFWLI
jgi:hypothetical protein